MKLLPLKEVKVIKAKERQLEVNEGMKLAKKVDALRETVAQEQADLIKFRDENIRKILDEIKERTGERDALLASITTLEERKRKALEPITEQEEELEKAKDELEVLSKDIEDRQLDLAEKKGELFMREKLLEQKENLIAEKDKEITKTLTETQSAKDRTTSLQKEVERIKDKLESEVIKKSSELVIREEDVAAKERDVKNQEDLLVIKERDINIARRKLDDEMQTFIRTQKRYGKRP